MASLQGISVRIAILANQNSWYARDLQRAIVDAGHVPSLLDFRTLSAEVSGPIGSVVALDYGGEPVELNSVNALIVRTMPPGSLEQVVFRMDVLGRLMEQGCIVVNSPKSIECAVDKFLTTARLAAAELPVPPTVCCETVEQGMAAFESLGRDVVLKPLFGAEGRGIVRLTDEDTAFRVFKSLRMTGAALYLQQFVEHDGFDTRLLVLDDTVVASMRRFSNLDFRTNVSQQGRAEAYDPTAEEVELARRAASAVGTRIAGVDILQDKSGAQFVLEVNAVPGWKALARVTNVDVAALLVSSIEQEYESR
jgi:ribosomal protein S6--L-glutamate ligase